MGQSLKSLSTIIAASYMMVVGRDVRAPPVLKATMLTFAAFSFGRGPTLGRVVAIIFRVGFWGLPKGYGHCGAGRQAGFRQSRSKPSARR